MRLAASVLLPGWREVTPDLPRLAVPDGLIMSYVSASARSTFERTVQRLEQAGWRIQGIRPAEDEALKLVYENTLKLVVGEMAQVHDRWFNVHELSYRPRTVTAIQRGRQIDQSELDGCRANQRAFKDYLESLMAANGIDGWLLPASRSAAPEGYEHRLGWHDDALVLCRPPSITVAGRSASTICRWAHNWSPGRATTRSCSPGPRRWLAPSHRERRLRRAGARNGPAKPLYH